MRGYERYDSPTYPQYGNGAKIAGSQECPQQVGIDVGLADFAMCSDGQVIANPRFLRTEERASARVQRQHTQLATGIRQRRKQHKAVARVHERITFRRHPELL